MNITPTTVWILCALTFAALPLGVALLVGFNSFTWPTPRQRRKASPTSSTDLNNPRLVSVLVPCRDEQAHIEACVRGVMQSADAIAEMIVYDDQSRDRTPMILRKLQDEFPKLRVLQGVPLPDGWVGKPHACHRLAKAASGDVLVFIDADTHLKPQGLEHLVGTLNDYAADLVTAVPHQRTGSWFERLILPILHLTYLSWFPLVLTHRSRDVRFLAANGQLLALHKHVYRKVGGFEAVRSAVVDDMAFCQRVKGAGYRVLFANGHHIAECRMYTSAREVWEGFSKNIFEGLGARTWVLGFVFALYTFAFLAPYIGLTLAVAMALTMGLNTSAQAVLATSIIGLMAVLTSRLIVALRHDYPLSSLIWHPISILGFFAIALNSMLWSRRGQIQWRGRTYGSQTQRQQNQASETASTVAFSHVNSATPSQPGTARAPMRSSEHSVTPRFARQYIDK